MPIAHKIAVLNQVENFYLVASESSEAADAALFAEATDAEVKMVIRQGEAEYAVSHFFKPMDPAVFAAMKSITRVGKDGSIELGSSPVDAYAKLYDRYVWNIEGYALTSGSEVDTKDIPIDHKFLCISEMKRRLEGELVH